MTVKNKKEKKREEIYIGSSDHHRDVVNRIGAHSIQIACILYISFNRFVEVRCVRKYGTRCAMDRL